MLHIGTVTRISGNKIYVTIPDLGGKEEFGALQMVVPKDPTIVVNTAGLVTGSGGSPAHTHTISSHNHTVINDYYVKGDRVVVAKIGAISNNFVVIGRIKL